MPDTRIVYGARCTWWDSIDQVGFVVPASGHRLPVCPHCGSPLFEVASEAEWWDGARLHEQDEPGYVTFLEWLRGQCFPTLGAARTAYDGAA